MVTDFEEEISEKKMFQRTVLVYLYSRLHYLKFVNVMLTKEYSNFVQSRVSVYRSLQRCMNKIKFSCSV